MVLVVPKYYGGLPDLEKKLTAEKLAELVKNFDRSGEEDVQVSMPKFTQEASIDLKDTLEKLGVKKMFDPNVNPLAEMSHAGLHIGAAVHKGKK
jgi:serpin B